MGVILLIGVGVFAGRIRSDIENLSAASMGQVLYEKLFQENSLIIDNGSGNVQTLEIRIKKGSSAFDLLKKGAGKLELDLKTKTYEDIGVFIEAIGDKENGQDGKYWLYYINGEMPSVAADKQLLKAGDKVEFRFEESAF